MGVTFSAVLLAVAVILLPVCAGVGFGIARWKRRAGFEGFLLGLFLGPLGLLIEAFLPRVDPPLGPRPAP
jgi:hypothetical protein